MFAWHSAQACIEAGSCVRARRGRLAPGAARSSPQAASAARASTAQRRRDARIRPRSSERDALRQRQLVGPVDGAGLAAHVGLPAVAAGLAAATRVLLAA